MEERRSSCWVSNSWGPYQVRSLSEAECCERELELTRLTSGYVSSTLCESVPFPEPCDQNDRQTRMRAMVSDAWHEARSTPMLSSTISFPQPVLQRDELKH